MKGLLPAAAAGLLTTLLTTAPAAAESQAGPRDPFLPTLGETARDAACAEAGGLRSLRGDEVRLEGLLETRRGPAALLSGPTTGGGLLARPEEELCDGRVAQVDFASRTVVLRLRREDPLRPWRERVLSLADER